MNTSCTSHQLKEPLTLHGCVMPAWVVETHECPEFNFTCSEGLQRTFQCELTIKHVFNIPLKVSCNCKNNLCVIASKVASVFVD